MIIYLPTGHAVQVDDEDYDWLSMFKWHYSKGKAGHGYARCRELGLMHRAIMGISVVDKDDKRKVDHWNLDDLDNRRENLRICTHSQNIANSMARSACGYKGVHKSGPSWRAKIATGTDRNRGLGNYPTPADAGRAYDLAAIALFGEFARLNFPDEAKLDPSLRIADLESKRLLSRAEKARKKGQNIPVIKGYSGLDVLRFPFIPTYLRLSKLLARRRRRTST